MDLERSFAADDWRQFAREIGYSRPGEFFLFEEDPDTGLCQPGQVNRAWEEYLCLRESNTNVTPLYRISKLFHRWMFEHGRGLAPHGARWCGGAKNPEQGPRWMRVLEKSSKGLL